MNRSIYIGVDIGGSHITVAAIDSTSFQVLRKVYRKSIQSSLRAGDFVECLKELVIDCLAEYNENHLLAICLSVPGPFDYASGIALFDGSNQKFRNLFGLDVPNTIRSFLNRSDLPIHCCNDALAFALGASHQMEGGRSRALAITLGSGLGSAFVQAGRSYRDGSGSIPARGELYQWPYKSGIAEDYFSSRALVESYFNKTGLRVNGVKQITEMAAQGEPAALVFWQAFGTELANFLGYWAIATQIDIIFIGGSISGGWSFFYPSLRTELDQQGYSGSVYRVEDTELVSMKGAVLDYLEKLNSHQESVTKRITTESLMPNRIDPEGQRRSGYSIYPTSKVEGVLIQTDLTALLQEVEQTGYLSIDGYQAVDWATFIRQANSLLSAQGIECKWYSMDATWLPHVEDLLADNLGPADSIFGKICAMPLRSLFSEEALQSMRAGMDGLSILYGIGASLLDLPGPIVYIDVPKNEIQFRMRAGDMKQLGFHTKPVSPAAAYKHSYFVTWPVLNRHKADTIHRWDFVIDGQHGDQFTWMTGNDYRHSLSKIAQQPFRARPWFEPGVWGGKWMQENIEGLNKEAVNYAWSFELITPENGLIIEANHYLFETSFDSLLYLHGFDVLGADYAVFGNYFPIRFDFLDTIKGGNLSIQCHPSPTYIREEFGEPFTQDETYYILEKEPDSKVYLGFQEDINPAEFKHALQSSIQLGTRVDIEKYVQSFHAEKHALYLIPNQTIHGSGSGNLVLEISSTPYIFTFKLYDWLRMGLDGKPRPLNIDHGFKNLDFSRKGEVVSKEFISEPKLIEVGEDWKRLELPTHKKQFYTVHRFHFRTRIRIEKITKCQIAMLVEGHSIRILTPDHASYIYQFAETIVIPASVQAYEVENLGTQEAVLLIAFVKEGVSLAR